MFESVEKKNSSS